MRKRDGLLVMLVAAIASVLLLCIWSINGWPEAVFCGCIAFSMIYNLSKRGVI